MPIASFETYINQIKEIKSVQDLIGADREQQVINLAIAYCTFIMDEARRLKDSVPLESVPAKELLDQLAILNAYYIQQLEKLQIDQNTVVPALNTPLQPVPYVSDETFKKINANLKRGLISQIKDNNISHWLHRSRQGRAVIAGIVATDIAVFLAFSISFGWSLFTNHGKQPVGGLELINVAILIVMLTVLTVGLAISIYQKNKPTDVVIKTADGEYKHQNLLASKNKQVNDESLFNSQRKTLEGSIDTWLRSHSTRDVSEYVVACYYLQHGYKDYSKRTEGLLQPQIVDENARSAHTPLLAPTDTQVKACDLDLDETSISVPQLRKYLNRS